jgi:hypothetical protein
MTGFASTGPRRDGASSLIRGNCPAAEIFGRSSSVPPYKGRRAATVALRGRPKGDTRPCSPRDMPTVAAAGSARLVTGAVESARTGLAARACRAA